MNNKTIIIGAGDAGKMVLREILKAQSRARQYSPVGFLDDDSSKKTIKNFPVLGKLNDAKQIIKKFHIETVIIAIPSASRTLTTKLITGLSTLNIKVKIVPGILEIIEGDVRWSQIRNVSPLDLLGREEVGFDIEKITPFYKGKKILITGAGGSIGSEIFKQILKLPIKKAIALGRGENNIHKLLIKSGNDPRINYIIGNVQDYEKMLFEIKLHKPDIIFHAAAHKHVPMMEDYPEEAVKNNIIGTYNMAKVSLKCSVKHFVLISTDKAVNPSSIMGASKRISEKIVLGMNQKKKTRFSLTRFGNVLGSEGSVIPTFIEQIKNGGPITITDKNMKRYFMSIPEAARLVIKAPSLNNGNIFVLNMGKPIRIINLAKDLIKLTGHSERDISIVSRGLRKGEKLYEELFADHSKLISTKFDKLLISQENISHDLKSISQMIKLFDKAAFKMQRKKIKHLIAKYIPEFQGII